MKTITLKAKDIREYILSDFGKLMNEEGYIYKKGNNEFVFQNGDNQYIINLLLNSWSTSYSLDMRLFVSQRRIENIFENIVGKWRHNLTLFQTMLERIYYSPDGRKITKGDSLALWMAKDEDVYNQIPILKSYYFDIAKPYFYTFASLEAFDNFINNPPFEYSPAYVGSLTQERCMKGLIVAKLVSNPDYNRLVDIYDELIKKVAEKQPELSTTYNKVKNYLGSR